jgi:6-phosphogluconolactonase (cycloisomerase 2 family)
LVLSPDGRYLFSAAGTVAAFRRDAASGRLTFLRAHPGLVGALTIATSSDGRFLYVGNRSGNATIAVFRVLL